MSEQQSQNCAWDPPHCHALQNPLPQLPTGLGKAQPPSASKTPHGLHSLLYQPNKQTLTHTSKLRSGVPSSAKPAKGHTGGWEEGGPCPKWQKPGLPHLHPQHHPRGSENERMWERPSQLLTLLLRHQLPARSTGIHSEFTCSFNAICEQGLH